MKKGKNLVVFNSEKKKKKFMNAFALETDTMNATPQEVVHKSAQVRQASARPPHLYNNVCFRCSFQV